MFFSVYRVKFLPIVGFENKIDHISTAYIHLNLVMYSPAHTVPNPQHFKFVIVSAVGASINKQNEIFYSGSSIFIGFI